MKPSTIHEYNKYMGGVDKCDQYLSNYPKCRRSMKWWKKVFFWLLELCMINSMCIYFRKKTDYLKKRNSHKKYPEDLIYMLVQPYLDKKTCWIHWATWKDTKHRLGIFQDLLWMILLDWVVSTTQSEVKTDENVVTVHTKSIPYLENILIKKQMTIVPNVKSMYANYASKIFIDSASYNYCFVQHFFIIWFLLDLSGLFFHFLLILLYFWCHLKLFETLQISTAIRNKK